jgi:hypothetical protein
MLIFDAALDLFEYLVSSPDIFAFLAGYSEPAADKLSMGIFTRFHQPWGDSFHGIGIYLYTCNISSLDGPKVVRVINRVIQTGFLPLFSDGENAAFVALLSLMPWMWSIVITNINRFMFDSPDVLMMEATLSALKRHIHDQELIDALAFLDSAQEVDIFLSVSHLCSTIVPRIETPDLVMIVKFFSHLIDHSDKTMRSPLYSVTTGILNFATQKGEIAAALAGFTQVVRCDHKESRRSYREMYLEAYTAVTGPRRRRDWLLSSAMDPDWPELKMFSRIVAVTIPHLYEVSDGDLSAMKMDELNSFPPLLPFEPLLLDAERFALFQTVIFEHRFEPFMSWWETVGKLVACLINTEDLEVLKQPVKVAGLKLKTAFSAMLSSIEVRRSALLEEYHPPPDEEEEDQMDLPPDRDAYAFVFVEPERFILTIADVNEIGNELFGGL